GRLHPGARRAALPVAQGNHGRAIARDREPVAGRSRSGPRPGGRGVGDEGPQGRPAAGTCRGPGDPGARGRRRARGRRLPRGPEDHLMAPVILAVAELADGALTKLSTEVATLARTLAESAGGSAVGLVVDAAPDAAAGELATYVGRVVAVTNPAAATEAAAPHLVAAAHAR